MKNSRYLCDNPRCLSHSLIEQCGSFFDSKQIGWSEWRFAEGFKSTLRKTQLSSFDSTSDFNLCASCREAVRTASIGAESHAVAERWIKRIWYKIKEILSL